MADVPDPRRRKARTRQHVIADLGVNYVERQVLLCGFTLERITRDYGLDLHMTTFSLDGQIENETVWFQVKATDNLQLSVDRTTAGVRVAAADLRYWLFELMPVILVLYDVAGDRAFWVEVQQYAEQMDLDEDEIGETVTIRLPVTSLLTTEAIRFIRDMKELARKEAQGPIASDPTA